MLEKLEKREPVISGGLKSEFLKNLNITAEEDFLEMSNEELRQKIIQEIKEGKLK